MTDAYHQISKLADSHNLPLRVGAFLLAVKRVADAEKHRGFD
jgi:glutamate dehydrogenase/leucine dehydrogenase